MRLSKHLKRSTKQDEREFQERMEHVPLVDKLIMIGTAFVVIVIPCLLVLAAMVFLVAWILRLL